MTRPLETPPDIEVPVLIVGGSMVGLSTALFLSHYGIQAMAVERHERTAIHPRAGHFHLRTLELLRSVGLEEVVARTSAEAFFPNGGINAVQSLAGGETASFISNLNAGVEEFSPTRRLFVAQQALEPILRSRAEELGADLRYSTEVVSVVDDGEGVTTVIRDKASGQERTVRSRYLVASDGWRSQRRAQLGIETRGQGLLSRSATIYFRADCRELLAGTHLGVIYVLNERLRGFFRFEKSLQSGFLGVATLGDPTRPGALDVSAGFTTDTAVELVRAAIGVPDIDVEIQDVAHWEATAALADRYRGGRIFLVGDAAHVVPPYGGFGGNTGVQDAHNLASKLALVLDGTAGEALLDTYEAERRPVGALTVDQAFSRYTRRLAPEFLDEQTPELVDDFSMELGYRYHSAAVLTEDDDKAVHQAVVGHPREALGRPGSRAPHVALRVDDHDRSVLDLLGRDFVVLAGPAGQVWAEAAERASKELGLPLSAYVVGSDTPVADGEGHFADAYGLSDAGVALVRPDGFIAWRSRDLAEDPEAALTDALRAVLCR
ncbi:FAD-dependent monooxygenase [Modestobacter lapidis]|nr:FAD-dependent monooxygenase [Modestobacter lapidis]